MWATPTTNDVTSEFTASESAVIQSIQGAVSNNLTPILARVINEIRGAIEAGGKNVDATSPTTIPPSLFPDCIAIARWRLLISMPQFKPLQSDARKDEYDRAQKKLELIATGKRGVESPTGTGAQTGNVIEEVQPGDSGNSRGELRNL